MSSFLATLIPAFDERTTTMAAPDRDGLAKGLVSIGEEAIAKINDALLDNYYAGDPFPGWRTIACVVGLRDACTGQCKDVKF